jgi:hypothetical protein
MSRPAPRRHRAARLLALTSGPPPTAEEAVDVRPKPELFRLCYLRSEGEGCVIRTYIFPGFTSPGLDSHSHDPRPRRNQYAPMERSCPRSACSNDHTASTATTRRPLSSLHRCESHCGERVGESPRCHLHRGDHVRQAPTTVDAADDDWRRHSAPVRSGDLRSALRRPSTRARGGFPPTAGPRIQER